MPATVIYKQGFPSLSQPVETSASIGADGLVTGSAVFLVGPAAPATTLLSTASLTIGKPISTSLFSGLRDVVLQGLFIETRNLEKRNGLTYLRLGVVGALNPPIVELKRDTSPRGFSKSESIVPFIINGTPITLFSHLTTRRKPTRPARCLQKARPFPLAFQFLKRSTPGI
jgi:hypothetical protein